MIVTELVLALAWTFGSNGFLIDRQRQDLETLPSAWLEPVAERVRVVFHGREDWAMAFYLPAAPAEPGPAPAGGEARVSLFAPYFLAPGGLVEVSRMPVDVAEYYFHALIEASLDLELEHGSPYAAWVKQRATELMADVPPAHRLAAYSSALSDFGAHLLSIRNEISRAAERQAASGRDVCRHLDRPASLFGLWRRSLDTGSYPGGYSSVLSEAPGAVRPCWRQSRNALERVDKDRFLAELLGVAWSGGAEDFETLCPKARQASPLRLVRPCRGDACVARLRRPSYPPGPGGRWPIPAFPGSRGRPRRGSGCRSARRRWSLRRW